MKEWQKEDDFFISTRACTKVEEFIKNHRIVVVKFHARVFIKILRVEIHAIRLGFVN